MKRALRRLMLLLALVLVAASGVFLWGKSNYQSFLETPLDLPSTGYVLTIETGMTATTVVRQLDELGFTQQGWPWRILMRLEPPNIHQGEFELVPGLKPLELLQLLSSANVIRYRFTLVEGWSFKQLREALRANETLEHTLPDESPGGLDDWLTSLDLEHPEGWFLPETYLFTRGDSDGDILLRAHQAMQEALADAWAQRQTGLPLDSPYELLILASIIEKETARDDERNEIAGVFIRRLNKGMRLQTDPTVIYGMGDAFDGDIRRRDLRTDTPYNTYTRFGLPPTPIAMPGRASLIAAGQPDSGDTLFFVADGQGGHTFSRTLEEHQKAVDKLLGRD